ncbi:ABC transporter substrate-binding protein [Ramlibacter albus]|uniref:ABC transporter substrate-binding protein n=1 Tax=Ramlibacter albus TaxID=2079448 RepID=A0A923MF63_9BURK|nr:ABC transporter substrate-binding protein [Ramlibacter albus]MBC5768149.1 ABC transporter substrate-binding protein [Ramlibacter albus]
MRRRTFITGTAVASMAGAFAQGVVPRLVILRLSPPRASYEQEFVDALRDLGFVDGKTVRVTDVNAGGDVQRLTTLAVEVAQSAPTVIFARGNQPLAAARAATRTVPIVAVDDSYDPVKSGFAASLSRPGGNVTGVFVDVPAITRKRMELLAEVAPKLSRIGVLSDPTSSGLQREVAESTVRVLRKEPVHMEIRSGEEIAGVFSTAASRRVDALLVLSSQTLRVHSRTIAGAAVFAKLPMVAPFRDYPEAGGLMSYGPHVGALYRRCASQLAKVMRGTKVGDIAIEHPDRFDLVINSRTAASFGLAISKAVLARADEIIS